MCGPDVCRLPSDFLTNKYEEDVECIIECFFRFSTYNFQAEITNYVI